MDSSFISKCLHNKFHAHKYQLSNVWVYNEESDFFSITSTGYAQEIEIKISVSDFKADFKKYKHNDFKQLYSGQKYVVRKGYVTWEITEPIMQNAIGEDGKAICEEDEYGRKRPIRVPSGKFRTYKSICSKDYIQKLINKGAKATALHTEVRIFKPILPNKFWFAMPEGLIDLKDIPEYAGLYYISEKGKVITVKRAPFIHKDIHNLDKVLLDKFYYLSQKLQTIYR